jgi:hypothetical protein
VRDRWLLCSSYTGSWYVVCSTHSFRDSRTFSTQLFITIIRGDLNKIGFFGLRWMVASSISNAHVISISAFQLPKTHIAPSIFAVVMLVRILWI